MEEQKNELCIKYRTNIESLIQRRKEKGEETPRTCSFISLLWEEMRKKNSGIGYRSMPHAFYYDDEKTWKVSMEEDTGDGSDGGSFWESRGRVGAIEDLEEAVVVRCCSYADAFRSAAELFKEKYGIQTTVNEVENKYGL